MKNNLLNRLLLGAGLAGIAVTVPTLVRDGVVVTDWVALIGYVAAFVWQRLPDTDSDGLPDPLEVLLRPPSRNGASPTPDAPAQAPVP